MEEVKKKYCVSIYTKGHWFLLSVSLIAEDKASGARKRLLAPHPYGNYCLRLQLAQCQ